jgi:hypothetical protein
VVRLTDFLFIFTAILIFSLIPLCIYADKKHKQLLIPELYLSLGKCFFYFALFAYVYVLRFDLPFGFSFLLFPLFGLEFVYNAIKTYRYYNVRTQHEKTAREAKGPCLNTPETRADGY